MAFIVPFIPEIIAGVSAAVGVAGTAVSVVGQVRQGEAEAQAAEYNAAVARNQAAIEKQQAEAQAQAIRERNERLMAAQRAAFAASGLDITSGSPLVVQQDTAAAAELDYRRALWGGDVNAMAARQRAQYLEWQGGQAQGAATLSAIGTGITGAADVAGGFLQQRESAARTDWYNQQRAAYTGGGQGGFD